MNAIETIKSFPFLDRLYANIEITERARAKIVRNAKVKLYIKLNDTLSTFIFKRSKSF